MTEISEAVRQRFASAALEMARGGFEGKIASAAIRATKPAAQAANR